MLDKLFMELTRRCNNSKILYRLFGLYGRDTFTVFFWRKYRKLHSYKGGGN